MDEDEEGYRKRIYLLMFNRSQTPSNVATGRNRRDNKQDKYHSTN